MPLVNVQVIENVFNQQQKREIIEKVTNAMLSVEGEALREVTVVRIEEFKEGNWAIGGKPLSAADVHEMQMQKV
ncbi:MAG: 4-oxalocrotonate tautomerase family protein [Bryobacterales bacterium]|nr:4-oxalocrotonate tautomerase family protein [Bryobacterales bacterium]